MMRCQRLLPSGWISAAWLQKIIKCYAVTLKRLPFWRKVCGDKKFNKEMF